MGFYEDRNKFKVRHNTDLNTEEKVDLRQENSRPLGEDRGIGK
jgi:hypothetical protein